MIETAYTADDFILDITVEDELSGGVRDLTGASVEGYLSAGGTTIVAPTTVDNAAAGLIRVWVPEDTFTPGVWALQVRVTIGSETQTIYDAVLNVRASLGGGA